jgi:hypothetical protein
MCYGTAKAYVRMIRTFMAAMYMQIQLVLLGCLMARARLERPTVLGYRLAWDETGQHITRTEQGADGSTSSQRCDSICL